MTKVEPSGDDTLTEILLDHHLPENMLDQARTQLLQYIEGENERLLADLEEYYQALLADRPATVKVPAWIGKNELQVWIDGRRAELRRNR